MEPIAKLRSLQAHPFIRTPQTWMATFAVAGHFTVAIPNFQTPQSFSTFFNYLF
jgi:hypothetical protein